MVQIPSQNHLSKFNPSKSRAILMLIRGNGGAGFVLLNQNEVKFEAKKIGFNVIILSQHLSPTTPMHKVFELIHSSHAVIRIHAIFLWPGSVFMQEVCHGRVARNVVSECIESTG